MHDLRSYAVGLLSQSWTETVGAAGWTAGGAAFAVLSEVIDLWRKWRKDGRPAAKQFLRSTLGALVKTACVVSVIFTFNALLRVPYLRAKEAANEAGNPITFSWRETSERSPGQTVYWYKAIVRTERVLLSPVLTFTFDGPVEGFTWDWHQYNLMEEYKPKLLTDRVIEQFYGVDRWRPDSPLPFTISSRQPLKLVGVTYLE